MNKHIERMLKGAIFGMALIGGVIMAVIVINYSDYLGILIGSALIVYALGILLEKCGL